MLHDQNRVRMGQVRFLFRLVPAGGGPAAGDDPGTQAPAEEEWDEHE